MPGQAANNHDDHPTDHKARNRPAKRSDQPFDQWRECSGALAALLPMHTNSKGGSRLTLVKLLAVRPTGWPSLSRQVTTVTPVAKQPRASRNVRGSDPVRYSRGEGGASGDMVPL